MNDRKPLVISPTLATGRKTGGPLSLRVKVDIPSGNLRVAVGGVWTQPDPTTRPDVSTSKLTVTPFQKDDTGSPCELTPLVMADNVDMPAMVDVPTTDNDGYYLDFDLVAVTGPDGAFKAVAKFEPKPEVTDEQWRDLRQRCAVTPLYSEGLGIGT
jgi:hypothetical protein